jgi:hypothetical protein
MQRKKRTIPHHRVNHDPVTFARRPTCCATCQLAYDQVKTVCDASFEAFGAQWRDHAPALLKALDQPAPCLLCGTAEVVTRAVYTPAKSAGLGRKVIVYSLCAPCFALPEKTRAQRTDAMLAREVIGQRN